MIQSCVLEVCTSLFSQQRDTEIIAHGGAARTRLRLPTRAGRPSCSGTIVIGLSSTARRNDQKLDSTRCTRPGDFSGWVVSVPPEPEVWTIPFPGRRSRVVGRATSNDGAADYRLHDAGPGGGRRGPHARYRPSATGVNRHQASPGSSAPSHRRRGGGCIAETDGPALKLLHRSSTGPGRSSERAEHRKYDAATAKGGR